MGRKQVNIIRYADDMVLIADKEDNLEISCQNYGMKNAINGNKSVIIMKKHVIRNSKYHNQTGYEFLLFTICDN